MRTRSPLLSIAVLAAAAGCTREHQVEVAIVLGDLRPDARVIELRVHRGAACPTLDEALAGAAAPVHAQVWRIDAPAAPVGRLGEGDWSFVAVARGATCEPIGFGCRTITVGEDARAPIVLDRVAAAGIACAADQRCDAGLCVARGTPTCAETCAGGEIGFACCGEACVSTRTDRAHCGGCDAACTATQRCEAGVCVDDRCTPDDPECTCEDRACPPGTSCAPFGDRCRPAATTEVITLATGATPAPCPLAVGVAWLFEIDGTSFGPMVVWSQPFSPGEPLRVAEMTAGLEEASCPGGDCGVALGQIVVAGDHDGDRRLSDEEYARPGPIGFAGVALAWSAIDRAATDPLLRRLAERHVSFPEGVLAGAAVYRQTGDLARAQVWVPSAELEVDDRVELCGVACDPERDGECVRRPRPFQPLP